jgi:hypothetical protein
MVITTVIVREFYSVLRRNYFSLVVPFVSLFAKVLQSCSIHLFREFDAFLPSISTQELLLPADFLLTNWSPAHETRCVARSLLSSLDPAAMVIVFLHFVPVRSGLSCYQFCFLLAGTWFRCWYCLSRLLCRSSFSTARSTRQAKFWTESLVRARKLAREHSSPADSRWSEQLKNAFPLLKVPQYRVGGSVNRQLLENNSAST